MTLTSAEGRSYEVVAEASVADTPYRVPDQLKQEVNDVSAELMKGRPATRERLTKLIMKYPGMPVWRNYLYTWYLSAGRQEQAQRIIEETHMLFPDYLFARAATCRHLIRDGRAHDAVELLHGKLDVADLYPTRRVFHVSECRIFTLAATESLAATGRVEEAIAVAEKYREIENDQNTIDALLSIITTAQQRKRMELAAAHRNNERHALMHEAPTTLQKADELKPEVDYEFLDGSLWDIDTQILQQRLAYNAVSFNQGLEAIVNEAIACSSYCLQEDLWSPVVLHSLLVLSHTDDARFLTAMTGLMQLPTTHTNHWLIDWSAEIASNYFATYNNSKIAHLWDVLTKEGVAPIWKCILLEGLPGFIVADGSSRDEVLALIEKVMRHFIANKTNENLFDTDVMAFAAGAAVNAGATHLQPLIEDVYAQNLASLGPEGDIEEVRWRMENDAKRPAPPFDADVYAHIARLKAILARNNQQQAPAVVPPTAITDKLSRNSPCPCGSGKKFKRCHGK
jgi:tetratricopeptide (TPR) repeat protein